MPWNRIFLLVLAVWTLWAGPIKAELFYPFGGRKMPDWEARLVGGFLATFFAVMAFIDLLDR